MYSVVYGIVIGPIYSIAQTLMGELTPPGFEYMVSSTYVASSSRNATSLLQAVFRFIRTVKSLRVHYWAKCDSGDNQQKWKQLEGFPILVCF